MYLSAEQRVTEVGGEHLSSSTVSSSLVTTPREAQLKLLVLSYNSDTGNKRRNTLNISGWWSRCLRWRWRCCINGFWCTCAHIGSGFLTLKFQDSELLMADMKVNTLYVLFGKLFHSPLSCCCFVNILRGGLASNQQERLFTTFRIHKQCQYVWLSISSASSTT